jgi:hypothetical protein
MEALRSSEMSVHIRTTRSYISEDGNIHNYRSENLKPYNTSTYLKINFYDKITSNYSKRLLSRLPV